MLSKTSKWKGYEGWAVSAKSPESNLEKPLDKEHHENAFRQADSKRSHPR